MYDFLNLYHGYRYDTRQGLWDLNKKCRCLRLLGRYLEALSISPPELLEVKHRSEKPNAKSALFVTRGASYRALGELHAAKTSGESALHYSPDNKYAHSLLGAIYYRLGQPEEGDVSFHQAGVYGLSFKETTSEREKAVKEAAPSVQQKLALHLYTLDPEKFGWSLKYMDKETLSFCKSLNPTSATPRAT
jgi:tetratricopeptide (TPR) repeat protein